MSDYNIKNKAVNFNENYAYILNKFINISYFNKANDDKLVSKFFLYEYFIFFQYFFIIFTTIVVALFFNICFDIYIYIVVDYVSVFFFNFVNFEEFCFRNKGHLKFQVRLFVAIQLNYLTLF